MIAKPFSWVWSKNWLFLAISLAYVVFEVLWNQDLIRTAGNPDATQESIEAMVRHGRMLAAFGLVFAFGKGMLSSKGKSVLFAACVVAAYFSLDAFYHIVISAIPAKDSLSIYELASYRRGVIKGDIEDPEVKPLTKDPLFILAWPLLSLDDRYMAPVEVMFSRQKEVILRHETDRKLAEWRQKSKDLPRLRDALQQQSEARKKFEEGYKEYTSKSKVVLNEPGMGSIFAPSVATKVRAFKIKTCGLAPGKYGSDDFAKELLNSCNPDYYALGKWYFEDSHKIDQYARAPGFEYKGKMLTAGQLAAMPPGKPESLIKDEVARKVAEIIPTQQTVKRIQNSYDVLASIVLPPMAATLSMLSVIANIGNVVVILLGFTVLNRFIQAWMKPVVPLLLIALVWATVPSQVFTEEPSKHLEQTFHQKAGLAANFMSSFFHIERFLQ